LQQTLKDLYRAYQNGFDKKKPINSCLSSRKSLKADPPFAIPSALKSGNRVYLPKIVEIGFL
jgi:hypothetical protein